MYPLGDHFNVDYEQAVANPDTVIQGFRYRITILSENFIRFEYNKDGKFEDRPTEFALCRNFERPDISIKEDKKYLEVTSKYFNLFYRKEMPFKGSFFKRKQNLYVTSVGTNRSWYLGHPEVRNLKGPGFGSNKKKVNMSNGLFSADGFISIDDSKSKIFDKTGDLIDRDNDGIDIYLLVYGHNFLDSLSSYFKVTGKPAFLPRYALGNWWARNEAYNDISLKTLMDGFQENDIPLSVLLLNNEWHINKHNDKLTTSGFTWEPSNFKSPIDMVNYLHEKGIRVGLNVNPLDGIMPFEVNYEEVRKYLEASSDGVVPFNVFDPKVIDVYLKILIHPLDEIGIDFFWIDVEDPKKKKELWYLNHYHINDMTRNFKRRPMILSHNPVKTPHRYPVLYSGKTIVGWKALKQVQYINASSANMGVSWVAHDIGGYHKGTEDNELYIRFVQLGVFSSILKFGSEKGKYYKREPWRWSIKTYTIVKDYLHLRHKLIPYLYTEAYKYSKDGLPVIKPVYYTVPEMYDDINYATEYYLGSELFISPIINKKDYVMNRVIHKFYIPEGVWYDFFTGKKFPGNKEYVSFYKDQDYPVFAKSGAIIPLGYNDNLNDTTPPKNMEIHIFPGQNNTFKLYEDDGSSDLYKKGFYLLTEIDYNYLPSNYTVIIRALEGKSGIVPKTRDYKIKFRNTKKADEVICHVNKTPVPSISYTDGADFIVEVKGVPTIGQLTINCKGKDIEIEATQLIHEEIESILSDLKLETEKKELIDKIIFSEKPIKRKRIELRKLKSKGVDNKFIKLFLKLTDYLKDSL
jgi:alpha-glucosidase (family GH31 glycosyl hydrolase)